MPNPAKYITILILLLCSVQSNAQFLPKKIRQRFTNCYQQSDSLAQRPFETEGYYVFKEVKRVCYGYGRSQVCLDTISFGAIFYTDGTYVDDVSGYNKMIFEEFATSLKVNKDARKLEWLGRWGIYRVEGDEIVAQSVFDPGYKLQLYKWYLCETRYKIIDRNTLRIISRECWDGNGKRFGKEDSKQEYSKPKYLPAQLTPFAGLPMPDSWLKKIDYLKCP